MSIFYFKNSAYRGDFSENASQFLILLRRRIRTAQLLPDSQIVGAQQEVQDALHRLSLIHISCKAPRSGSRAGRQPIGRQRRGFFVFPSRALLKPEIQERIERAVDQKRRTHSQQPVSYTHLAAARCAPFPACSRHSRESRCHSLRA